MNYYGPAHIDVIGKRCVSYAIETADPERCVDEIVRSFDRGAVGVEPQGDKAVSFRRMGEKGIEYFAWVNMTYLENVTWVIAHFLDEPTLVGRFRNALGQMKQNP